MKYFIGCDPGKLGSIVVISEDQEIIWSPMPLLGELYDFKKLREILTDFNSLGIVHTVLEDVHSLPGVSAKANFSFGYGLCAIESALSFLDMPFTKVTPKTWQKLMHQGVPVIKREGGNDTKTMSLFAVQRLFPNQNLLRTKRCTKPDEGFVDGLLMAEYCRRNFK